MRSRQDRRRQNSTTEEKGDSGKAADRQLGAGGVGDLGMTRPQAAVQPGSCLASHPAAPSPILSGSWGAGSLQQGTPLLGADMGGQRPRPPSQGRGTMLWGQGQCLCHLPIPGSCDPGGSQQLYEVDGWAGWGPQG